MKINQNTSLKLQTQLLQGFDLQMVQSIYALPGALFSSFVEEYCLNHPALDLVNRDQKSVEADFSWISKKESLYDHLCFQIKTSFLLEEKQEALAVAASLDKNGFYDGEITPVVKKMWYLDPLGVAAKDAREALKVQLCEKGLHRSLSYRLLDCAYKEFLKRDVKGLCSKLKETEEAIHRSIEEIKKLNPFPGRGFECSDARYVVPEMILTFDNEWSLSFVKEFYPSIRMIKEAKGKDKIDALRFIHLLKKRKNRLEWIVSQIVKRQSAFLQERGELEVLDRQEVLSKLDISQSTFSRLLSEKFIETPVGIYSLGYFFSHASIHGSSVDCIKSKLKELIEIEDKSNPFTDEVLKDKLNSEGFSCTRRRVAKYRKSLGIPGVYDRARK